MLVPTYVYVLCEQFVRHLVLVHNIVVESRAGKHGTEEEAKDTTRTTLSVFPSYCNVDDPSRPSSNLHRACFQSQCLQPDPSGSRQTESSSCLRFQTFRSIPPSDIAVLKDSRSPKRAHRLAHRRGDNIHHPLRGLEAATGGDLGEAGGRAGETCAAERGGHAKGHCCVCVAERSV